MNTNLAEGFWDKIQLICDQHHVEGKDDQSRILYNKIASILNKGCGLTATSKEKSLAEPRRTVPSAGNIYPYEILVATRDVNGRIAIFIFCCLSGKLFLYKQSNLNFDEIINSEFSDCAYENCNVEFAVLVLNRPWATVRKYGDRGLMYGFLDCAHATTNIVYVASELHSYDPIVNSGEISSVISNILDSNEFCSLLQSIIYFPSLTPASSFIDSQTVPKFLQSPAIVERREANRWEAFLNSGFFTKNSNAKRLVDSNGMRTIGVDKTGATERNGTKNCAQRSSRPSLVSEIDQRYSARAFNNIPIGLEKLTKTLSHSSYYIKRFMRPSASVNTGIRVIARNIADAEGVFEYDIKEKKLVMKDRFVPDIDFRHACMNQKVARNAAALLVIYGSVRKLLKGSTIDNLKEVMFSAGQVGQMLYLGASIEKVGISAIGGFDSNLCRQLAMLPENMDPVYVFLIGNAEACSTKDDQNLTSKYYRFTPLEEIHGN